MIQRKFSILAATLFISLATLFMPSFTPAYAQTTGCTTGQDCAQKGLSDVAQAFPAGARDAQDLPTVVHKIINWALYIAAIAAVIMIIVGGYRYIFSGGDAAAATKGRTTMVNALIGLALIVLSYIIVQVVYRFLIGQ